MSMCAVYRHFDATGQLLYVGCAANPSARMGQHVSRSPWATSVTLITVQWHPNKAAALEAETAAIAAESPVFNRLHHPRIPAPKQRTLAGPLLARWFVHRGIDPKALAKRLGVRASTLDDILAGRKSVHAVTAEKIEAATDGWLCRYVWNRDGWCPPHANHQEREQTRWLLSQIQA